MSRTVGDVVVALGKGIWTLQLRSLALLAGAAVLMLGTWKAGDWAWDQLDQQASEARWAIQYYRQNGTAKNIDWLERKLLADEEAGRAIESECAKYIMAQRELLGVWIFLSSSALDIHRDAARFICLVRAANDVSLLIPWEPSRPGDADYKAWSPAPNRSYE